MARKISLLVLLVLLVIGFVTISSRYFGGRSWFSSSPNSNVSVLGQVSVTIKTDPPDIRGQILLNGETQDVYTPNTVTLTPGIYDISVQAYGYQSESKEIVVRGPGAEEVIIKMLKQ